MKRARWEGNEIILTDDMENNSNSLVENFDDAFDVIGATTVMTGLEVTQAATPDMTIIIPTGIAYDRNEAKLLVNLDTIIGTVTASDPVQARRDIVEIKRLELETTLASRQFKNPSTGAITVQAIDTETEYNIEVKVLAGSPGGNAPAVESGWIKISEILVPASSITVIDANIFNSNALAEGLSNTGWTTDIQSIHRNGSISEMNTLSQNIVTGVQTLSALNVSGHTSLNTLGVSGLSTLNTLTTTGQTILARDSGPVMVGTITQIDDATLNIKNTTLNRPQLLLNRYNSDSELLAFGEHDILGTPASFGGSLFHSRNRNIGFSTQDGVFSDVSECDMAILAATKHIIINQAVGVDYGQQFQVTGSARFTGSVGNIIIPSEGNIIEFSRNGVSFIDASNAAGYVGVVTGGRALSLANTSLLFNLDQSVTVNTTLYVDTIAENSTGVGVTIDSVLLKDNGVTANNVIVNTLLSVDTIAENSTGVGVSVQAQSGEQVLTKIIDIGDWNMNTTTNVSIAHGLTQLNIRSVQVLIRQDADNNIDPIDLRTDAGFGGWLRIRSADIDLLRTTGGLFDDTLHQATSFNRGWITIKYVV